MGRHSLSRLGSELRLLLAVGIVLSLSGAIVILVRPLLFLSDLFCHFRLQFTAIGLIGALVFLVNRQGLLVIASILSFLIHGFALLPLLRLSTKGVEASNVNTALLVNVHTRNSRSDELLRVVSGLKPQLLALLEIDNRWAKELAVLDEHYQHKVVLPRADNFGIAFYSTFSVVRVRSEPFGKGEPVSIEATLDIGGRLVTVLVAHAVPPITPKRFQLRNQQLSSLAARVVQGKTPSIIMGDLNVTPWSAYFSSMLTTAGLTDPRTTFGILSTWPGYLSLLGIPIDHFLVTAEVEVLNLETITVSGSDHLGLLAEFVVESLPGGKPHYVLRPDGCNSRASPSSILYSPLRYCVSRRDGKYTIFHPASSAP